MGHHCGARSKRQCRADFHRKRSSSSQYRYQALLALSYRRYHAVCSDQCQYIVRGPAVTHPSFPSSHDRRYELASAFFILAGQHHEAVSVLVRERRDPQLALLVARLLDGGATGGPVSRRLVERVGWAPG